MSRNSPNFGRTQQNMDETSPKMFSISPMSVESNQVVAERNLNSVERNPTLVERNSNLGETSRRTQRDCLISPWMLSNPTRIRRYPKCVSRLVLSDWGTLCEVRAPSPTRWPTRTPVFGRVSECSEPYPMQQHGAPKPPSWPSSEPEARSSEVEPPRRRPAATSGEKLYVANRVHARPHSPGTWWRSVKVARASHSAAASCGVRAWGAGWARGCGRHPGASAEGVAGESTKLTELPAEKKRRSSHSPIQPMHDEWRRARARAHDPF